MFRDAGMWQNHFDWYSYDVFCWCSYHSVQYVLQIFLYFSNVFEEQSDSDSNTNADKAARSKGLVRTMSEKNLDRLGLGGRSLTERPAAKSSYIAVQVEGLCSNAPWHKDDSDDDRWSFVLPKQPQTTSKLKLRAFHQIQRTLQAIEPSPSTPIGLSRPSPTTGLDPQLGSQRSAPWETCVVRCILYV